MSKKPESSTLEVVPPEDMGSKSRPRRSRWAQPEGVRLDDLEKAIISQLQDDGRKPFQTIARELGVDEKTVRNRVGRMRERGMLRIIPTTEGNALRDCIVALVAITISQEGRSNPEAVAQRIAALPCVSWVGALLGRYDIIAEVVVESRDALARFQMNDLPKIPGVGLTEGFLVMSHYGSRGVPFVDELLKQSQ
ncbi:MAG: Lrp/AsnC family transcriptional regulator [Bdellovibrionales bacterium]|nr:Lrp/AsnC family transcriptional regulator [Bdellovibrionales bacterium]